ncbi:MAG: chaperone NapD [Xanthobacteraceae bacterium]|nr:chaperone NapD [Xanthobacteraceae bacterium]
MAGKRHSAEMDRRDFIHGRWPVGAEDHASASVEIASILVQARPERLDDVAQAIEAMPGTQIFSRDPRGKLVVVIEAAETGAIGSALNDISLMPHVLTAALVFHGTDEA